MKLFICLLAVFLVAGYGLSACGSGISSEPTPLPISASPTSPSSVPTNTLKIRVTDYAPASYRDSTGQWTGLDVEIARALVEKAGFTPKFIELPFSRGLSDLQTGEIHIMANLSQTPERSKDMTWIGPERTTKMGLVVKEGNEKWPINTLDDLISICTQNKANFGIQKDVIYSKEFNDRLQDPNFSRCFEYVPDSELNPGKVIEGRILGFFEETNNMGYQIAHNPKYKGLALHSFILASEDVYLGISKKGVSAEVLARLQDAFAQLEKDGTFAEIRNRVWK